MRDIKKKILMYIITLILATLYIVIGIKITASDNVLGQAEVLETRTATVKRIIEVVENSYDISTSSGTETLTDRTVYFYAYVDDLGREVMAKQALDSFSVINPKEVSEGDNVIIINNTFDGENYEWVFAEHNRMNTLAILVAVFVGLVVIFGRFKGVNTIVSLVYMCGAIFWVFVPAILAGYNPYIATITTCLYAIFMTLLLINGWSKKALCSALGCMCGLAVTGILTVVIDHILMLTGITDQESMFLLYIATETPIDLNSIIFAGILIGALGAIMDVSVSISSALYELAMKMDRPNKRELIKSGFNIGRDILGTMANTLILAYIGSSLSVVLLLTASSTSLFNLLNREMIVVEIMQAVLGSLGIFFTIPATTILASTLYLKTSKKSVVQRANPIGTELGSLEDMDTEVENADDMLDEEYCDWLEETQQDD